VLVLFWKLMLSRMLEDVTRAHIARTEDLLRAVQARYETGLAGQHEMLRLGILRDRLEDELRDFARVDRELSAALSRALSRPTRSEFATPEQLEPRPVSGNVSDWLAIARRERPELKRLEESVHTAQAAAKLARIDGIPDFTVWMGYRVRMIDTLQDDGTDQVSAGVSVPIPWASGRRSRAEQADIGMKVRIARTLALCVVFLGAVTTPQSTYAMEFDQAMEPILTEYLKIQTSLAADSTEGVAAAVHKIESSAKKLDPGTAAAPHREHYKNIPQDIVVACGKFNDPDDLSSVREAFQELSKPISMWVTMARPEGKHVMYCSMKKAGWVQQGSEVANPYYGSEMLTCGYEVGGGR
jgi:hypothetical protein